MHELIEQYGAQNDSLSALQGFDGKLISPLEHVLERTIKRFDRLLAQHMEDTTDGDCDSGIVAGIQRNTNVVSRLGDGGG